jgi:hypothetical protein
MMDDLFLYYNEPSPPSPFRRFFLMLCGGIALTMLMPIERSLAIPSLTPHQHGAKATTWNPPGADNMRHQHRDKHELDPNHFDVVIPAKDGEPTYGFSPIWVWDNRKERYDFAAGSSLTHFGHG